MRQQTAAGTGVPSAKHNTPWTVALGHVDSVTDGPSVFYELGRLRPGDDVIITRADGSIATFTVDGIRRYPKEQFPSLLVYGDTDHPSVRLITCGGAFDQSAGRYLDNIVVFASIVDIDLGENA